MSAGMKVAVIGGGSTYTPELVSGLSRLDVSDFVLHDTDRPEVWEVQGVERWGRQPRWVEAERLDGDPRHQPLLGPL